MDICKNSDNMTQAFLAQVAILVQTITSEFLNWTGRCCLYPIAGSAVLLLFRALFLTTCATKSCCWDDYCSAD